MIKYFKIEVLAAANNSNSKGSYNYQEREQGYREEREKRSKKMSLPSNYEYKADNVLPTYINTNEYVIILNDEPISNGMIDKYFVVKNYNLKCNTKQREFDVSKLLPFKSQVELYCC